MWMECCECNKLQSEVIRFFYAYNPCAMPCISYCDFSLFIFQNSKSAAFFVASCFVFLSSQQTNSHTNTMASKSVEMTKKKPKADAGGHGSAYSGAISSRAIQKKKARLKESVR